MDINMKDAAIGAAAGAAGVLLAEGLYWAAKRIFKKKGGEKPQTPVNK